MTPQTLTLRDGVTVDGEPRRSGEPTGADRRVIGLIHKSIERAHQQTMDRRMDPQRIVDIRDSVQACLDELVGLGALLGGRVWVDPEINSPAVLASGRVYLDFDIEPPGDRRN